MSEVRVERLSKSYAGARALDEVTLTFPDGGFFGLLGPSGSGKTTLLRAIAGFVEPDAGRVIIGDRPVVDVPVEAREIGMVFQNYALFPNMTVRENVGFGLRVRRVARAEAARRVAEALELVHLGPLGARKPHELSGGQRQRVAMARAIVTRPRVLLLDEPLSALDKALRVDMQIELKRIQREVGITTIFVTHDQEEALTLSDRIGILKGGRLIREGRPEEVYADPGDVFTARFLGEANVLEGRTVGRWLELADGARVALPEGANGSALPEGATRSALPGGANGDALPEGGAGDAGPGGVTRIAVRPEHVAVSVARPEGVNALRAELRQRIFAGATGTCVLDWQGQTLKAVARHEDFAGLPERGPVWLSWPDRHARPLAAEEGDGG